MIKPHDVLNIILLYQSVDLLSIYHISLRCLPALGLNTIHFPVDVLPPFTTSDLTKTWKFHHWSVRHFQSWNPPWICRISRFCYRQPVEFIPVCSTWKCSSTLSVHIYIHILHTHTHIYIYNMCISISISISIII